MEWKIVVTLDEVLWLLKRKNKIGEEEIRRNDAFNTKRKIGISCLKKCKRKHAFRGQLHRDFGFQVSLDNFDSNII